MSDPIYNPGQPQLIPIAGGFIPGRIAHVTGIFAPNGNSLILQFQTGPYGDPNDEIGLCIYNRLNEGIFGMNAFTRTSGWGQEQAIPNPFFQKGQAFEITILCDPYSFKVAVNQQHLTEFSHRLNPSSLTHLNIKSSITDLTVSCVWIEDPNCPPIGPSAPQSQFNAPGQSVFPPVGGQQAYPSPPFPGHQSGGQPSYGPQDYSQQQYGGSPYNNGKKDKGLIGMVSSAGAAVAGALGASHLLGKKSKHGMGGYPSPGGYSNPGGYPSSGGYPGPGVNHGPAGYPSGHSSGGGGLLNKALGIGGGLLGAKAASKGLGGLGGGSKALKYGLPLAGVGVGGYMLSKGMSRSFSFGSDCSDGWGGDCGGDWSD